MLPTFSDTALSRLPAASREKAVALDNQRQAAHAALAAVNARLSDAYGRRNRLENDITNAIDGIPQSQRYAEEIDALKAPILVIDAEIANLKAEVGRAEREFATFDCIERAAKWLTDSGQLGRTLKHQAGPKMKAGGDYNALVERARARIDDLAEQIEAVELAPAPSNDLRERIAAEVDRLAEAGRPVVDHRDPDSIGGAIFRAAKADAFPIWLARDTLVEKLTAEVQDAPHAMSAGDKDKALAELADTLLAAERDEETIVVAAQAAGTTINRRRAADPRALLEIA